MDAKANTRLLTLQMCWLSECRPLRFKEGRSGGSLGRKITLFVVKRIHVAITACTTTTS